MGFADSPSFRVPESSLPEAEFPKRKLSVPHLEMLLAVVPGNCHNPPGFPDRPNLHQHDLEERHLSPMVNIPVVG